MVNVQTGSFHRTAAGALLVVCAGRFPHRALPLFARVGEVVVEGISISPDGRRFIGRLARAPNAGDELVVHYLPEPASHTGIRYPSLPLA